MTRPRKRPVGGRYWVVVDASGSARDCHTDKRTAIGLTLPTERLVECVAMPRVVVREGAVFVNEIEVMWGRHPARAKQFARDLRRALRKGNTE